MRLVRETADRALLRWSKNVRKTPIANGCCVNNKAKSMFLNHTAMEHMAHAVIFFTLTVLTINITEDA